MSAQLTQKYKKPNDTHKHRDFYERFAQLKLLKKPHLPSDFESLFVQGNAVLEFASISSEEMPEYSLNSF
jgi:hypothetical protein